MVNGAQADSDATIIHIKAMMLPSPGSHRTVVARKRRPSLKRGFETLIVAS